MQPSNPRFPRRGTPHSFGWVRAPKLDHDGWLAWERPDGANVWLHHSLGEVVQLLPCLPPQADYARAVR